MVCTDMKRWPTTFSVVWLKFLSFLPQTEFKFDCYLSIFNSTADTLNPQTYRSGEKDVPHKISGHRSLHRSGKSFIKIHDEYELKC